MSDTTGSSGEAKAAVFSDALVRGRNLVLAAFDEARSSGREEWYLMTTAVLKNRLLNSTNREFSESEFGVSSMIEFARMFPEDLEVDTQSWPPIVRFTRPEALPTLPTEGSSRRRSVPYEKIRPDLWRAVVDYRSGSTYAWDEGESIARVANVDDTSPVVPTVTEIEVAGWRQSFADSTRSELRLEQQVGERLDEWLQRRYGAGFLPPELRGKWNRFFREKVEKRLRKFFEDHNLNPPDDLVTASGDQPAWPLRSAKDRYTDVPRLRALVQRCVTVMTEQELTELRISPAVMLRAIHGRS